MMVVKKVACAHLVLNDTEPAVTSITLDIDRSRAYIRFSCLHQNYLGYAYMEKRDGKWAVVRFEGDVDVD